MRPLSRMTVVLGTMLPFFLLLLLLIGGLVDEAMNELEKFCSDSSTTLPIRLKATLLECFDRNNYVMISTCFEDILKKDPTCSHSLARLISMHQNGDYSPTSLLEMIALHLDATYANENTWREFALCFLKLSRYDEDRMSVCLNGNESEQKQFSIHYDRPPTILTEGKIGQSWKFRCKWWLNRHFSKNMLASDIAAVKSPPAYLSRDHHIPIQFELPSRRVPASVAYAVEFQRVLPTSSSSSCHTSLIWFPFKLFDLQ